MSASSTVLEDSSRLSWADRTLFRFESVLALLGGVVIFLLVFLASANILGRWLFDLPIDGYVDWVEQAMAFFAFLGLSFTQRLGGHIRMDMLVGYLRGRLLWLSELVSALLMFLITLVLIYGSYLHFYRAYQIGDSSLDIDLPTWPAKLVVPVALGILALRLLLQIWGYLRGVLQGGDSPVAVPLIEDAATVAAKEAEAVMGSLDNGEAK
ncbi:TRAP transporter small permease [Sedimenticola hydrogenitrophicus]|uniref:TRAP transporter small permease n=1 Tax=Sedimenticola hydrogenitrophicus TaxID=2967975 RepID=UPI0021A8C2A0|nr:TRAP transporter small permease [Sedimenticola hydrogenitrophicus]